MLKKVYPLFDYFKMHENLKAEVDHQSPDEVSGKHLAIAEAVRQRNPDKLRDILFSKHYQGSSPLFLRGKDLAKPLACKIKRADSNKERKTRP